MKALFIGGTGLISTAVSKLAIERGWDLTLFNRGQHIHGIPEGANIVTVDINDDEAVRRAEELGVTLASHCRDGRIRVLSRSERVTG